MSGYRPDIDGLRSVAVLLIVFFHFHIPGFEGGYVGVDVFYVISGYLIGSIILKDIERGSFSLAEFYRRRIARLYPAYIAMMLVSTALAFWLFLPREFRDFGKSIIASVFYASNILFYRESGYFDTSAYSKPLLHTWSLSIEEQFYLLFPVTALWLLRSVSRRRFSVLVSLVLLASLLLSIQQVGSDRNAAFYLFPYRMWELLLGVLVATGQLPRVSSPMAANLLAVCGIAMIAAAAGAYGYKTAFPGLAALVPCLGALLIIYSGLHQRPLVNRLLSLPAPVFVGLLSYSLYLWHWPIVVFAQSYFLRNLNPAETALFLLLTLALAAISWRYIEQPFRQPASRLRSSTAGLFVVAGSASAVLAATGYVLYRTDGLPARLAPDTARFAAAATDFRTDWRGCVDADNPHFPGLAHCPIGDPYGGGDLLLVWGDSHARAYKGGLDAAAKEGGRNGLFVWHAGCPPLFGVSKSETTSTAVQDQACASLTGAAERLLAPGSRVSSVILIGRWSYYSEGKGVGADERNEIRLRRTGGESSPSAQKQLFTEAFLDTVKRIRDSGKSVRVLQQVPEISPYNSQRLAAALRKGDLNPAELSGFTQVNYEEVAARQATAEHAMQRACTLHGAGIIRTHSVFCQAGSCSAMLDGVPAFVDNNHVTVTTSLKMRDLFSQAMHPGGQGSGKESCCVGVKCS